MTVLEKEHGPARHQTGRNSGVIHSGIYYRPGSLKARYALRGSAELADFCAEHGIAHATTGKLIVATERSELPRLHGLVQRGREHGLPVRELGPAQIAEYEPEVRGLAAIRVATTGVCDFTAVATRFATEVAAAGGVVRYGAEVTAIDRRPWGVAVRTADGLVVRARTLVNCAGLHCDRVARLAGDDPGVRIVPFRGEYYELARPELVRGLVYPVPDPAFPFLGVHLTRGFGRLRPRRAERGPRPGPRGVRLARGAPRRTAVHAELAGHLDDRPQTLAVRGGRGAPLALQDRLHPGRAAAAARGHRARPAPVARRGPGPGGAEGRHAGRRLPDPRGPAHRPCAQRSLARRDGVPADRAGGGAACAAPGSGDGVEAARRRIGSLCLSSP
ncbi:L-2-hydroxyglutarate dehydrogenase [Streptomyces microflavus]